MNIKQIILYNHSGEVRQINFNSSGLSIITGRSSTGKSSLSEIVEYCMGRSTFNIPEGPIRDKVAWYGVIFQYPQEQILIAKPAPSVNASSCSRAMIRRGVKLEIPAFESLEQNADDDTVVSLLSKLLGIPSYHTDVPVIHSREPYKANIKHTHFYLFQKQSLIANKDQLFYRQNENFIPQSIKDTLPILLGIFPDDKIELEMKLREKKRELKILQKQLNEREKFEQKLDSRIKSLIAEAKSVGIIASDYFGDNNNDVIKKMKNLLDWRPKPIPDSNVQEIIVLENELRDLRKSRADLNETLRISKLFLEKTSGFTSEAKEQISRLESIYALPYNEKGEWQWPFAPEELNLNAPVAKVLLNELESLEHELKTAAGEKPNLDEYIKNLNENILVLNRNIRSKEEELSAAISTNEIVAQMDNLNAAAARTIGRISLFLENYSQEEEEDIKGKIEEIQNLITKTELAIGADSTEDRIISTFNIISSRLDKYVKAFEAEFSEFTFRLDLSNLTVVADRPDRPVPMHKTGGAANHLAYHIAAILSLHDFSSNNRRFIPSFLFLDQPTQVYFPSEHVYRNASGTIEETEKDSDINKVRRLFEILYQFATNDCPNFQIIVTEHANLRDEWFQNSLIESPWLNPPALIPDSWEMSQ